MLLITALPAAAQIGRELAPDLPPAQRGTIDASGSVGQLPASSTGLLGQRKTRDQTAPNIAPGGRIEERINNRIASRLDTRIGGSGYSTQANTLSAYNRANEETSSANRKSLR